MASIGVVTDSTADLDVEVETRLGLAVVPLIVNWDGQTYRDKTDLGPAEFYRRLRTSKSLPKTGAPSLAAFESTFRDQLKERDAVICLNLAAKLSGTFEVARRAAESVDPQRIWVVDSGSVSICIGWLAEMAVQLGRQGVAPVEIGPVWAGTTMAQRTTIGQAPAQRPARQASPAAHVQARCPRG